MSFRVGQKVVAVGYGSNPVNRKTDVKYKRALIGKTYTIRGFFTEDPTFLGVYVEEIVNDHGWFWSRNGRRVYAEPCHSSDYFRPLVDISSLESIVADVFSGKKREIKGNNPLDRKHKIVAGLREAIEHARSLRK